MRAFLSYSHENESEAQAIYARLSQEPDIDLTMDAIDLHLFSSPKSFMESVREHDAVVHLISLSFLRSRNCMRELLSFMKDDTDRHHYRERTVPILLHDEDSDINLFESTGQLRLIDYWWDQKSKLEEAISSREEFGPAIDEVRGDLTLLRDIAEHVLRFMRTVTDNIYAASYPSQIDRDFADVIQRLRDIESLVAAQTGAVTPNPKETSRRFRFPSRRSSEQESAPFGELRTENGERELTSEERHLLDLYNSIVIASEDEPDKPEFPPFSPRFPATPHFRIPVPRLKREIIIKDESRNFTGSHKDRMAWEIVVFYKDLIQDLLDPRSKTTHLPTASIISNGSAAMAIQVMLRCYGLPPLKVLIDEDPALESVEATLRRIGCEVYKAPLAAKELDSADVLDLTANPDGFDLTARNLVDPNRRTYYDWLAYEILNCGAKHIYIPVGTGDLFVNLLTILRDELLEVANDKRLEGGSPSIRDLALFGATSDDPKTRMDKLYAPHRPTRVEVDRVLSEMKEAGQCDPRSAVVHVDEKVVSEALDIAALHKIHADASGIAGLSLLLQQHYNGILDIPDNEDILVVNTGWQHLY
jgi:hypothetical protein